jgi:hypothetical protein
MSPALWVYRIILFAVATFAFLVLLDYGPSNFPRNAGIEWGNLTHRAGSTSSLPQYP